MPIRFDIPAAAVLICCLAVLTVAWAQALPAGGMGPQGAASGGITTGTRLVITNAPSANINWQTFNIGSGNPTQFVQPGAGSLVVNRVASVPPSIILGNLVLTGKVFVINPKGVVPTGAFLSPLMDTGAFQLIGSGGMQTIRTMPPPPGAVTQAVVGADGIVRLTLAQ